jgi:hypothetical protein
MGILHGNTSWEYFMGIHFMGIHFMGIHFMGIQSETISAVL